MFTTAALTMRVLADVSAALIAAEHADAAAHGNMQIAAFRAVFRK
jgi:hypothetical protein